MVRRGKPTRMQALLIALGASVAIGGAAACVSFFEDTGDAIGRASGRERTQPKYGYLQGGPEFPDIAQLDALVFSTGHFEIGWTCVVWLPKSRELYLICDHYMAAVGSVPPNEGLAAALDLQPIDEGRQRWPNRPQLRVTDPALLEEMEVIAQAWCERAFDEDSDLLDVSYEGWADLATLSVTTYGRTSQSQDIRKAEVRCEFFEDVRTSQGFYQPRVDHSIATLAADLQYRVLNRVTVEGSEEARLDGPPRGFVADRMEAQADAEGVAVRKP